MILLRGKWNLKGANPSLALASLLSNMVLRKLLLLNFCVACGYCPISFESLVLRHLANATSVTPKNCPNIGEAGWNPGGRDCFQHQ